MAKASLLGPVIKRLRNALKAAQIPGLLKCEEKCPWENESVRLPAAIRRIPQLAYSIGTAASKRGHCGGSPGFIEEYTQGSPISVQTVQTEGTTSSEWRLRQYPRPARAPINVFT